MAAVTSIRDSHEQHIAFFVPRLLDLSMARKGSATICGSSDRFLIKPGEETTTSEENNEPLPQSMWNIPPPDQSSETTFNTTLSLS